jgi:hypothetical protein
MHEPIAAGGATVPGVFVPCSNTNQCASGLVCASINTSSGSGGSGGSGGGMGGGYCTQTCTRTTDCTAVPATGSSTARCLVGQCILGCGEGVECPDGMTCLVIPVLPNLDFCHF